MKRLLSHHVARGLAAIALVTVMAACGDASVASTTPPHPGSVQAAATATVQIPHADRFAPFVTAVTGGGAVTFHNGDTDPHSLVSVPGDPLHLDHLLQPGEFYTVIPTAPGAHVYYCSLHARYDPKTTLVSALPRADHPDEPMQGVLVVAG